MQDAIKNNFYYIKRIISASKLRLFWNLIINICQAFIQFLLDVYVFIIVLDGWQNGVAFPKICSAILGIGMIQILFLIIKNIYESWYIPQSDLKINKRFKKLVFEQAKNVDLCDFENPKFYDQYIKAAQEVSRRALGIMDTMNSFINSMVFIFSTSFVIFTIDPILIFFIIVPFFLNLFIGNYRNKIQYQYDTELQETTRKDRYIKRLFYLKDYAEDIRMTNISRVFMKRFHAVMQSFYNTIKKYGLKIAFFEYIDYFMMEIFVFLGSVVVVSYKYVVTKSISLSNVLVVINTISSVAWSLRNFSDIYNTFQEHALYIENFKSFLKIHPKIKDKGTLPLPKNGQSLVIKNLSFRYPNSTESVLKNINLQVLPGQKIVLVGPNGAGKSTLLKLILRLYEPNDGEILLNDNPISKYPIKEYRNNFGTIFQDYQAYAFSILDNIYLKNHINKKDRERALKVLHDFGMDKKIMNLEKGIDTHITREFEENGISLSNGELQKICLARIFVKPFPFLLLDEPSSALDPIAEYQIYQYLLSYCKDKTVFFISHRLSTAVLADKVYYLENGEIIESGTHDELLKMKGKYSDFWKKQTTYYQ